MAHSIMMGCAKMGMDVAIGHPKGYAPDGETSDTNTRDCGQHGAICSPGHRRTHWRPQQTPT